MSTTRAPGLRPSAHIFVGSKAPWFTITDDLPHHDEFGQRFDRRRESRDPSREPT